MVGYTSDSLDFYVDKKLDLGTSWICLFHEGENVILLLCILLQSEDAMLMFVVEVYFAI